MTRLVDVGKAATQRSDRERIDRARSSFNRGSAAAGVSVLGLSFQSRMNETNGVLYGKPKIKGADHNVTGTMYGVSRRLKEVKTSSGVGVRQSRMPSLAPMPTGSGKPGVFSGKLVPNALAEVMGNQAPGRRVLAVRLRSGGPIHGGTLRGLGARGAFGAGLVGGTAGMVSGVRQVRALGRDQRQRRAQRAAETRRLRATGRSA